MLLHSLTLCFLHTAGSMAQDPNQPAAPADSSDSISTGTAPLKHKLTQDSLPFMENGLEIDGLIFDQTLTKSGRDFYEIFYTLWQMPPEARNFTIIIRERPSLGPGMGTQINIVINDDRVASMPLQPRFDFIERAAKRATGLAYGYLIDYERIRADLNNKDQLGSGIY